MYVMSNITRRAFLGSAASAVALTLAACGGSGSNAPKTDASGDTAPVDVKGTYERYVQGDDWGCGVAKVTLSLDAPLDAVDASTIAVT